MVTFRLVPISFFALPLLLAWPAVAADPDSANGLASRKEPSQSEIEDGQRHYKRGVELFKNGVYDAALIEFRRAYEIAPSFKILYNIAQVSRQLDDYASAVDAYQRYLREGKGDVPAAREMEVKAELERINQWVGRLEISSSSPDATIAIDDIVVGRGTLTSLLVNSGRRKVTATMAGRAPLTRVVDVAGGETAKLSFDFATENARASSPTPTEPTRESTKPSRPVVETAPTRAHPSTLANSPTAAPAESQAHWWLWGGTAVLAAGSITTGMIALRSSREIDDMKDTPAAGTSTYDERHKQMSRFALATDVLAGLAVATGTVALYLTLTSPSGERKVGLSISPTGAVLSHAF
jgi:hypothetical protein